MVDNHKLFVHFAGNNRNMLTFEVPLQTIVATGFAAAATVIAVVVFGLRLGLRVLL